MKLNLETKPVLVTGSTHGIGKEIAQAFLNGNVRQLKEQGIGRKRDATIKGQNRDPLSLSPLIALEA